MNNNGDGFPWKVLLFLGIGYAIYRLVQETMDAFARLLDGLVIIALAATAIFVFFWVYRHITDDQYGETKSFREIAKWEQRKQMAKANLPKHMHAQAEQYFTDKQMKCYDLKTYSRWDSLLEGTKQVIHVFRGKGKNE